MLPSFITWSSAYPTTPRPTDGVPMDTVTDDLHPFRFVTFLLHALCPFSPLWPRGVCCVRFAPVLPMGFWGRHTHSHIPNAVGDKGQGVQFPLGRRLGCFCSGFRVSLLCYSVILSSRGGPTLLVLVDTFFTRTLQSMWTMWTFSLITVCSSGSKGIVGRSLFGGSLCEHSGFSLRPASFAISLAVGSATLFGSRSFS